jgi:glucose dehydrogenase
MRTSPLLVALFLALLGLVWIGQGVGLVGGSFMTGSPFWAAVGLVLVAVAAAILVRERRGSARR